MALTKVTGQVIKNTTDVTVGVLTVTNTLAVGGTVSIGGTLTYEDVTNVDAVGLITARNGIVVGSGITLSKDGDGFFTGIVTATSFSGSGANLTDVDVVSDTTPQLGGNLDVNTKNIVFGDSAGATDDRLTFGAGTDLSIYHNGNDSYIEDGGTGALVVKTSLLSIRNAADTEQLAKFIEDSTVELYHNNAKKLETSASGIKLNGVENAGAQLIIGAGDDLQLEHDGSGSALKNSTGILYVQSDDLRLTSKTGGQLMFKGTYTGAAELYNANARKLSTAAGGLEFFGRSVDCQVNFNNADNSTRYGGVYGYTESGVDIMAFLKSDGNYSLVVNDNGEVRTYGHVRPNADNSYDLGLTTHRWRNIYTMDLQLSNKGSQNNVDGTWGDWTLQEGESDIFMINNRSGKKFKIKMEEVS